MPQTHVQDTRREIRLEIRIVCINKISTVHSPTIFSALIRMATTVSLLRVPSNSVILDNTYSHTFHHTQGLRKKMRYRIQRSES